MLWYEIKGRINYFQWDGVLRKRVSDDLAEKRVGDFLVEEMVLIAPFLQNFREQTINIYYT